MPALRFGKNYIKAYATVYFIARTYSPPEKDAIQQIGLHKDRP